jgi:hypothetical protein
MNTENGYYSCSVNPSYISTWYCSFKNRAKFNPENLEPKPEKLTPADGELFRIQQLFECGHGQHHKSGAVPVNLADNSHHGRISEVAKKKLKKAIDYTVYLAQPKSLPHTLHGKDFKFKLNFITLTLASTQIHSDLEIKNKIFQPMLNAFRQKYGVINYVWRAEKQGNGNIHFHIITDKFIPWNELRNDWNKFQQNLGYVTRYREAQVEYHKAGFKLRPDKLKHWPAEKQFEAYKRGLKCQWDNPNSSDVHSLRTVTNVRNYFLKYLTKDEQSDHDRPNQQGQYSNLAGRLWGCSSRLTKIKGARTDIDSELTEELQKLSKDDKVHFVQSEFFSFLAVDINYVIAQGYKRIEQEFEAFIRATFPEYRPPDLFTTELRN